MSLVEGWNKCLCTYLRIEIFKKLSDYESTYILTFPSLKSYLLSLIRPKIKSTFQMSFGIRNALGLRFLFQLRVNLSQLRSHKMRHNFSDTPSEICECNLCAEDIRHFYLNALFM